MFFVKKKNDTGTRAMFEHPRWTRRPVIIIIIRVGLICGFYNNNNTMTYGRRDERCAHVIRPTAGRSISTRSYESCNVLY